MLCMNACNLFVSVSVKSACPRGEFAFLSTAGEAIPNDGLRLAGIAQTLPCCNLKDT